MLDLLQSAGIAESSHTPDERLAARLSPARQAELRAHRAAGVVPRSGALSGRSGVALALARLDGLLAAQAPGERLGRAASR